MLQGAAATTASEGAWLMAGRRKDSTTQSGFERTKQASIALDVHHGWASALHPACTLRLARL